MTDLVKRPAIYILLWVITAKKNLSMDRYAFFKYIAKSSKIGYQQMPNK